MTRRSLDAPTDPVAFARLDAQTALEKLGRLMMADGQLSGVLSTSVGDWVFVPARDRRSVPPAA